MAQDFFNYMFSKGPYDKNYNVMRTANVPENTQENASIMESENEADYSYINEMKLASTKREEKINTFLTTPEFIETLNVFRPGEHPELSGYASSVEGGLYSFLEDLNELLIDKKNGQEITEILMLHFEGSADAPESLFEANEAFWFDLESDDSYKYYGDMHNLDGLEAQIDKGKTFLKELRKDLGPRLGDFQMETNENGYFTSIVIEIDGTRYSLEQEYFENSGYPLSRTKTTTYPDGKSETTLTCYSYGQNGEFLPNSDVNNDGVYDTIINYDDSYNIISFENLNIFSTEIEISPEFRNSVLNGYLSISDNRTRTISRDTQGNYTLHIFDSDNNKIDIPITEQGYMEKNAFCDFMRKYQAHLPVSMLVNKDENVSYRINQDYYIEKYYLDDGTVAIYTPQGELVSGYDKARDNSTISTNEQIDTFRQGTTGNCWLLAELDAFSQTERGAKLIESAIKEPWLFNSDYRVELAGKEYSISEEEIRAAKNNAKYSYGDDDVLIFELAYEKYLQNILDTGISKDPTVDIEDIQGKTNLLNGGHLGQVSYAILGHDSFQFLDSGHYDTIHEQGISQFNVLFNELNTNFDSYATTVQFVPTQDNPQIYAQDINGNQILLANGYAHAWSVQSVQDSFVTLCNPWNNQITATIHIADIRSLSNGIGFTYIK